MKILKGLYIITLFLLFFCFAPSVAQSSPNDEQASSSESLPAEELPDLAELIPLAAKLSGQLAVLETQLANIVDVAAVEQNYSAIANNLKQTTSELNRLSNSQYIAEAKISLFKQQLLNQQTELVKVVKPIRESITNLSSLRKKWSSKKNKWNNWRLALLKAEDIGEIPNIFDKADAVIDTALGKIIAELAALLKLQKRSGEIEEKFIALNAKLEALISQRTASHRESPSMLSKKYVSLFTGDLWDAAWEGIYEVDWSANGLINQAGWVLLLQALFFCGLLISIFKNRATLFASPNWKILAKRPFSASFFFIIAATLPFLAYEGIPGGWGLVYAVIFSISFYRFTESSLLCQWKRKGLSVLVGLLIINKLLSVIMLPVPLLRLIIAAQALFCALYLKLRSKEAKLESKSKLTSTVLSSAAVFSLYIFLLELIGKSVLAEYLFSASIKSLGLVCSFTVFLNLIVAAVKLALSKPLQTILKKKSEDIDDILYWLRLLIKIAVWLIVLLPALLAIWGKSSSFREAVDNFLGIEFTIGGKERSLGLVFAAAMIFYCIFLGSWILQEMIAAGRIIGSHIEWGIRVSIARLIHYFFLFGGFLLAVWILGFDFTKLIIVISALGVGIGFGLQTIVNNFLSGLILLFERPIRVGDSLDFKGEWVVVRKIGLRATTVRSFDDADIIIPNALLITDSVTNWTLSSRRVRLKIPVGVAYGSDIPRLMEILLACAKGNCKVLTHPAPQALFLNFGESTLNFELRAWVVNADEKVLVQSELNREIEQKFRESAIEIAYPQRDLHLRTIDNSVIAKTLPQNP